MRGLADPRFPATLFRVGSPEAEARKEINRLLVAAGWIIHDRKEEDTEAGRGVGPREFPRKSGPVDYVLYVDGAVAGATEAKKEGWTLGGVEVQTKHYGEGLPDTLPACRRPLPSSASPPAKRPTSPTLVHRL